MKTVDIVCVAPHPDDAEMTCGGFLLKAKKAGLSVGIIDCTRGEMGTRGSVAVRKRESDAADRLLGTDVRVNLRLRDGGLHDDRDLYVPLVTALRLLRPRLLLVPHWDDLHPDHAAVGQAGPKAAWLCGVRKFAPRSGKEVSGPNRLPYRPELVIHYQNRYGIQPDLIVDISETFEGKLALARCYSSQFGPPPTRDAKRSGDPSGEPMTRLSSEGFFGWFRSTHAYYGTRIGVAYGEPYCTRTPLPVFAAEDLFRTVLRKT